MEKHTDVLKDGETLGGGEEEKAGHSRSSGDPRRESSRQESRPEGKGSEAETQAADRSGNGDARENQVPRRNAEALEGRGWYRYEIAYAVAYSLGQRGVGRCPIDPWLYQPSSGESDCNREAIPGSGDIGLEDPELPGPKLQGDDPTHYVGTRGKTYRLRMERHWKAERRKTRDTRGSVDTQGERAVDRRADQKEKGPRQRPKQPTEALMETPEKTETGRNAEDHHGPVAGTRSLMQSQSWAQRTGEVRGRAVKGETSQASL
ncbi:hypothetical protein NDU88_000718 [Pleurodeles waltl]|uniref:Uncharacterized protein n=1 Tax=Pleurodeles waltl TaxID=8319 RepID=A0AAV7LVG4_PLEWA|nr:hypothetical protein NDU88_000718 [Pleurodeles waltl]